METNRILRLPETKQMKGSLGHDPEGLRSSFPWCFMGDFNEILSIGDKKGGVEHPPWLLRGFRSTLSNCFLCDLQLEGYPYAWAQGRGTNEAIEERVDRAIVSMTWLNTFPNAKLQNLVSVTSDHTPIEIDTCGSKLATRRHHRFRFENKWLREPDIDRIVSNYWKHSQEAPLMDKLKYCASSLQTWGRGLARHFKDKIQACSQRLS